MDRMPPHLAASPPALPVLQVIGNSITGGMEIWVGNLAGALRGSRRGIVPTIVAPFASRMTERWLADGHPVHIAPVDDEAELMHSVERVVELARRTGAKVIQSHLPNANAVCSIAAEISGVPALATLHGRQLTHRDLEALQFGRAHALVVGEAALAQARLLGLGERVSWIPNGVDPQRFRPRDDARPRTTPVVGFVGRFAPEKGPDDFVRMAARLGGSASRARFRMLGDGPLRPALQAQITRAGLADRFELPGVVDDMPAAYRELDLVVSTSHSEGSPLAILEAMAAGVPVVATGVGGVPEIVCDDVTGRVVSPHAVDALADAVAALLGHPARMRAWGHAARERVLERYTLDAQGRRIADLLERLAAAGSAVAAPAPVAAPRAGLRLATST